MNSEPELRRWLERIGLGDLSVDTVALALTHRSAGHPHNERLEFLGDVLLSLVVSEHLFERLPRADEGRLTRLRSQIVREASLAAVARRLELGDQLQLGVGELKSGGFRRDSILADALEALLAAVYQAAGLERLRGIVLRWFAPELDELGSDDRKDAKTRLQEWLQSRQLPLPNYRVTGEFGTEHAREFQVSCELATPERCAQGRGSSRKAAEQAAAEALLAALEVS